MLTATKAQLLLQCGHFQLGQLFSMRSLELWNETINPT